MRLKDLLGKKLKEIRETKGLTQQELAELCDMHTTTIGMIEIGKRTPSLSAVEVLVEKLDIDYSDLFDFSKQYSLEQSDERLKLELGKEVQEFDSKLLKHMISHAKSLKDLFKTKKRK